MTTLPNFIEVNGISIRYDLFLNAALQTASYQSKKVAFKRDTRIDNSGFSQPWDLEPKRAVSVKRWQGRELVEVGVYQIWERRDGCGIKVEFFENEQEHTDYTPCQDAPNNWKNEIGLCQNYHTGI